MAKGIVLCAVIILGLSSLQMVAADETDTSEAGALGLLTEAVDIVKNNYVEHLETKDVVYRAIAGLTASLDKYSAFMTPENFRKDQRNRFASEITGIGIILAKEARKFIVKKVIENSAAFKNGVREGDVLLKIDGRMLKDVALEAAQEMLEGEVGTRVVLTLLQQVGVGPRDIEVEREALRVRSIMDVHIIEKDIGYIKVTEFRNNTGGEFNEALKELLARGIIGLIIDLRDNGGGREIEASEVIGNFLPKDTPIVVNKNWQEKKTLKIVSPDDPIAPNLRLAVLVNQNSASGSEIVAAAAQESGIGKVVGTQTYGKGSIQNTLFLSDGSAIRLTAFKYYTPKGRCIEGSGILPDVIVSDPSQQLATAVALIKKDSRD